MDIAGKVAVVTGAGSGIGAALTRLFTGSGARVMAVDIDLGRVAAIASESGAYPFGADVSREEDNVRLIDEAENRLGPIDLFCANAGIAYEGSEQSSDEEWERMWRVNFLSHVYAARHLVPRWQDRGAGYFLATASAAGLLTNIGAAQYSVTKHAAVAFAEWLSITYGDEGIKVSCLCPQGVLTPILEKEGETSDYLRATAITPEAVAESVLAGLHDERFLILPHPEVAQYEQRRTEDRDGWLEAMRRLRRNLRRR
jgi:NAD(P)-dependent dehydrogenase (short-subunit alcohol dehydrogenase family)